MPNYSVFNYSDLSLTLFVIVTLLVCFLQVWTLERLRSFLHTRLNK